MFHVLASSHRCVFATFPVPQIPKQTHKRVEPNTAKKYRRQIKTGSFCTRYLVPLLPDTYDSFQSRTAQNMG